MKVSACIVTYNNKDKIQRTINSLFEYTKGVDFQLFVVDNASTDGTADFIAENFPQVSLIRSNRNAGFGAGHNMVLPFLDSDYHAVVNPDIILKDDAMTALSAYCADNKDVGLLSPQIRFEDGRLQHLGKKNPTFRYLGAHFFGDLENPGKLLRDYCMLDEPEDKILEIQNATGCFMFFRTSVFKELGGFDERFFMYIEDSDIARRASKISKVLYYPAVTVIHLWCRESKRNKKLLRIHIQSIIKYFLKWGIRI